MRFLKRSWGFALLAVWAAYAAPVSGQAKDEKVEVKVAKLDALKDLIKQHKGKVVVVDFWSNT